MEYILINKSKQLQTFYKPMTYSRVELYPGESLRLGSSLKDTEIAFYKRLNIMNLILTAVKSPAKEDALGVDVSMAIAKKADSGEDKKILEVPESGLEVPLKRKQEVVEARDDSPKAPRVSVEKQKVDREVPISDAQGNLTGKRVKIGHEEIDEEKVPEGQHIVREHLAHNPGTESNEVPGEKQEEKKHEHHKEVAIHDYSKLSKAEVTKLLDKAKIEYKPTMTKEALVALLKE